METRRMSHSSSSASSAFQFRGESLGFPALSLCPPNGTEKWKWGGKTVAGWWLAAQISSCLICPPPSLLASSTSLLSHTPVFPLSCSFSISYFLPHIYFFLPSLANFLLPPLHCPWPTQPYAYWQQGTAARLSVTVLKNVFFVWILNDASCYIQYISHMWTVYSVNWRMNAAATLIDYLIVFPPLSPVTASIPFFLFVFPLFYLSLMSPKHTHIHTPHTTPFPI